MHPYSLLHMIMKWSINFLNLPLEKKVIGWTVTIVHIEEIVRAA